MIQKKNEASLTVVTCQVSNVTSIAISASIPFIQPVNIVDNCEYPSSWQIWHENMPCLTNIFQCHLSHVDQEDVSN